MKSIFAKRAEDPATSIENEAGTNSGSLDRRSFFRQAAIAGGSALLPMAALTAAARPAAADRDFGGKDRDRGDAAILRFLAAAELIEQDLWEQYTELALNNAGYHDALSEIDDAFPQYSADTTNDEQSHAVFINAYLRSVGEDPVSLDAFRTLPSVPVQGARQIGRLTNLTNLTVDTSWYNRYRSADNPDFGDSIPQIVNIVNRTAVPTSNTMTAQQLATAARVAVFHFPTIEQGGTSLYATMLSKVSGANALRIVASIGPVEAVHFSIFHGSLEDIEPFDSGDGFVIPTIDDETRHAVMPKPCKFLRHNLPLCSVIRPTNVNNAGAVAAATALTNSNLFQGQPPRFFKTLFNLAHAADAAYRDL